MFEMNKKIKILDVVIDSFGNVTTYNNENALSRLNDSTKNQLNAFLNGVLKGLK